MTDTVDWKMARRVASKVAARQPFAESYLDDQIVSDFDEFTEQAEQLVGETTGLWSHSGKARGRVAGRDMWIDANIASFQRLLRPLLDKMSSSDGEGLFAPVGSKVAGAELGAMLGWMSSRVLGQYDLLVIEDENPEDQDIVYYVGPNIVGLERKYAFDTRQFRLWLALHEVTHRAQFTGVPWLRQHFLGLVNGTLDSVDPDPQRFLEGLKRALEMKRAGDDPLADGGIMALLASQDQRAVLDQVAGLMSLLEGHGDITMDRAGEGLIPSQERFARVLRNRRQSSTGFLKLFQRVMGIDAKIKQYQQGEDFIEAVEEVGGTELLDLAWESSNNLPLIDEIRDPKLWIARMEQSRPEVA